jgi:hypothetical protein
MTVSAEQRLPASTDRTLAFSLYAIFRDFARAINSPNRVDCSGDIIIDSATSGLVLKDAAATPHYWRVTVSTTGALITTDLGTTRP